MADDGRVRRAIGIFRARFAAEPEAWSLAPGRLEVLGNHTDYNDGLVLLAAVERGIAAAGRKRQDGEVRIFSEAHCELAVFPAAGPYPKGQPRFGVYPSGVVYEIRNRGAPIGGFEAVLVSDLPEGAGLSSSAALECATALLALALYPHRLDRIEIAKACRDAENRHAGVPCGILDQIGSLFGKRDQILRLDARSLEVKYLKLPRRDLLFAVCDSGVRRELADGRFAERRRECAEAFRLLEPRLERPVRSLRDVTASDLDRYGGRLPEPLGRRARHVVSECARVEQASLALVRGDLDALKRALFESHESSRTLFENSHPALDDLVAAAMGAPGVFGSRLTGGGFGGATMAILEEGARPAFEDRVSAAFRERHGRTPGIDATRAGDGAEAGKP